MSNGQVLLDDNNKPVTALYDPVGHQVVNWQATFVSTDATTSQKYASAVLASPTSATGTLTSVAASISSSTQLLAANTGRKGMYVFNDSSAVLYLGFSATVTTSSYTVQVPANSFFEMPVSPVYTGVIAGVWSAAVGNARITEMS